jgi:class 3 adenylate cyclase/tetratricopeptide (TPR) repeat protein
VEIAAWLRSLGLEQYEPAFRDNHIDAELVLHLTGDDLKDLGVVSVGHRRKLLDAIAELNNAANRLDGFPGGAGPASAPPHPSEQARPPDAERRQLTVLFCDLVGSTALSAFLDPEDYRSIIAAFQKACATTIARFDGFLAKYMGDGVLAYFGYPRAHEEEASRAVRAGLALVEDVTRVALPDGLDPLHARVGIATGLVVVGDLIGTGSAQEQSVAGETPNLAARLQTLAPPNGVLIAPSTRRLLGSEFQFADLGLQDLKGFAAPVRAWRVLGTRAVESRFEARGSGGTPLVGRTEELGILTRCWEQVSDGGGQAALLSGEAGIGKSRLVRGLLDRVQSEAHARVQHQCSPFFSNSPLHPFIEQIERDAGFQNEDTPEERLAKLEILLAQATDDVGFIAPLFATLLTIPMRERYPPSTHDPQQQKQLTVEALAKYLLGRTRLQPLLIVVEDVHWADPTTLELLQLLIDRVSSGRALLLITFRPEFSVKWQGRPHVTLISLNRLARRHTTELAKGIAGGAGLPDEVFNQILERTDGVPLFIEEFTKAVLEGSRAEAGSGTARSGPMSFSIPATLHDSLMARLDRLPAAKVAAQQAAVIGREFTYRMLTTVSQQSEPKLREALQHLVSSELVFIRGAPPEATYTFKHALVRDAAYESLLKSRRQELHARIAAVLERDYPDVTTRQPELIAYHLSEARLAERAVTYWQWAADAAASRQAHQEAIAHCSRGLEMVGLIPDRKQREQHELRLQARFGNSAISVSGWGAAEVAKALYRARELCRETGDSSLLHPILAGLFAFHVVNAELSTAERLGLELLTWGETHNDRIPLVDGHKTLMHVRYKLGKFEAARKHFERGMSLYQESPWPEMTAEHLDDPGSQLLFYGACVLWVLGYPDRARQAAADAITLGRQRGHHLSLVHSVYIAGHLSELMDDWESVQRSNRETIALSTEWGLSGILEPVARRERLVAVALHCDPEQMEYKRRHPQPGFARSLHDAVLARAYGRRGEPEEGLRILEGTPAWADETGSRFFDAEVYRTRAELLLLTNRPDEAEQSYYKALETAREQKARMWELHAACGLARLWRDQGHPAEAHDLLAPIYSWFSEGFDTRDLQAAQVLLATLSMSPSAV